MSADDEDVRRILEELRIVSPVEVITSKIGSLMRFIAARTDEEIDPERKRQFIINATEQYERIEFETSTRPRERAIRLGNLIGMLRQELAEISPGVADQATQKVFEGRQPFPPIDLS